MAVFYRNLGERGENEAGIGIGIGIIISIGIGYIYDMHIIDVDDIGHIMYTVLYIVHICYIIDNTIYVMSSNTFH